MSDRKPPRQPPDFSRWILLVLLFVGFAFNNVHRTLLSLAAPLMMTQLHLSTAAMGLLLSAFFWTYALLQVPAGWLADRSGVKRLYGYSFAAWCLISAATGLGSSFLFLLLMRAALGWAQSPILPTSTRAVATWFSPTERGTATGIYTSGSRVGLILMTPMGAWILGRWGWQAFFVTSGLAGLVFLLPWYWFFRRYGEAPATPGQSPAPPRGKRDLLSFRGLFRYRFVWGISLGFFAYDYAWYLYLTWLPGYLMLERRFSLKQTGIYGALPMAAMSVMIPLAGIISDWLVRRGGDELRVRKMFLSIGLLLGCLIVPAGLTRNPYTAVLLLTLSLGGLGLAGPNTWTLTIAVSPKPLVGTLAGVQNFWGNVGGILAPAVTGYIVHATGSFVLALGFCGAVLALGTVAYLVLIPGRSG